MRRASEDETRMLELNRSRQTVYLFLSRAFSREVDPAFFDAASELVDSFEELFADFERASLIEGRRLLESFLQGAKGKEKEAILQDLAEDYAFLFLGVGSKNVSLCESAYRSAGGLLFQGSYFDIVQRYTEVGLAKRPDFPEPEDHLSVELSYMANLCRLVIDSAENRRREEITRYCIYQKTFLQDHLMTWVPDFFKSLLEADPSTFYSAIAHLLKGFISLDAEIIDSWLTEVAGRGNPSLGRKR